MSYPIQFEEVLHWFYVKDAYCDIFERPSYDKVNIIRCDQDWGVDLCWTVCGPLPCIMCGKWVAKLYLEEMGKNEYGFPPGVGHIVLPFQQYTPYQYKARINVPANTVPPGIYKLVCSILFYGPTHAPGPITGFCEGPLLNFYKPGKYPIPYPYGKGEYPGAEYPGAEYPGAEYPGQGYPETPGYPSTPEYPTVPGYPSTPEYPTGSEYPKPEYKPEPPYPKPEPHYPKSEPQYKNKK